VIRAVKHRTRCHVVIVILGQVEVDRTTEAEAQLLLVAAVLAAPADGANQPGALLLLYFSVVMMKVAGLEKTLLFLLKNPFWWVLFNFVFLH